MKIISSIYLLFVAVFVTIAYLNTDNATYFEHFTLNIFTFILGLYIHKIDQDIDTIPFNYKNNRVLFSKAIRNLVKNNEFSRNKSGDHHLGFMYLFRERGYIKSRKGR